MNCPCVSRKLHVCLAGFLTPHGDLDACLLVGPQSKREGIRMRCAPPEMGSNAFPLVAAACHPRQDRCRELKGKTETPRNKMSWVWQCVPVILALGRWSQEDQEVQG